MALVALPGLPLVPIGAGVLLPGGTTPTIATMIMDAANEALCFIGHVVTSDGGSHTIDTTGSSSLGWMTGAVTFANAGTTVKVGLAAVDTATGPPGRPVNAANVITFDVSRSMIGGGGGITANAWQTHAPDAGTKTIANGDLIAFCIQMTARGGVDTVSAVYSGTSTPGTRPITTILTASFSAGTGPPTAVIMFADGALGYFYGGEVFSTINTRTWNSTQATKEYGQLLNLPFPMNVFGIYGWLGTGGDAEIVLYSDPLGGSPIAEKTIVLDASTVQSGVGRKAVVLFPTPYAYQAGTDVVAAFKPTTSTSVNAYYKTLAHADHRITEPFGASGYGVSRATGAFANANSSLDHYYIGLLAGAFNETGGAPVLGGSVIS